MEFDSSPPPVKPEFLKDVQLEGDHSPSEVKELSFLQLIYSLCGLLLGLACILGGILLFLHGVLGSISWTTKILGASSQISDAAPGGVLFIVGVFLVFITRFKIVSRRSSDSE
jgi:uncharacterized membrane protein (UPF0182 family)